MAGSPFPQYCGNIPPCPPSAPLHADRAFRRGASDRGCRAPACCPVVGRPKFINPAAAMLILAMLAADIDLALGRPDGTSAALASVLAAFPDNPRLTTTLDSIR